MHGKLHAVGTEIELPASVAIDMRTAGKVEYLAEAVKTEEPKAAIKEPVKEPVKESVKEPVVEPKPSVQEPKAAEPRHAAGKGGK